jgi:hypothetical protein
MKTTEKYYKKIFLTLNEKEETDSFTGLKGDPELTYKDKDGKPRKIKASSAARYPEDHPAYQAYMVKFADDKADADKPKGEEPKKKEPAKPQKLSGAELKSDAEKRKDGGDMKLKNQLPKNKKSPLDAVPPTEKPVGKPQGEYKPNPDLKPPDDSDGEIPNTDIPVKNKENPDPKFIKKFSTKMDKFAKRVLEAEAKAQIDVISAMKKEGKLPSDFKPIHPRDMEFGFKHPALKDNPKLQKELANRIKKENKPPHFNMCKVSIPGTNKFCDENINIPREKMPQLGGKPKPGSEGEAKAKRVADQKVREKLGLPKEGEIPANKKKEYNDLYSKQKLDHVNVEKEFEEELSKQGIKVSEAMEVPTSSLKATQNELVGEQVVGMTASLEENPNNPFITAPIMVTRDGYIVDGHHRWASIHMYNAKHSPPNGNKPPIAMKIRVVDEDIDTHIPRANKFAERMGIETMSGEAKK